VSRNIAADTTEVAQWAYAHYYNLRAKAKQFEIGVIVLILLPNSTNKVVARWQRPGTVTAQLSPNSYRVALDTGAVRTLHANHLRSFIPRVRSVGVISKMIRILVQ